jgi:conjugal transfer pilus assembly protein TraF
MKKTAIIALGVLSFASSFAAYKSQGWQWYENVPYIDYDKIHEHYQSTKSKDSKLKPSEQLKKIQDDYKEVHSYAVLHPEDVQAVAADKAYINYFYDKSVEYGATGQKALLMYPQLSANVKNPMSQIGQQIKSNENRKDQDKAIRKVVSHNFGMFFFYKGNDPMAQAMAPSLQRFADEYNIKLIGISEDSTAIGSIKDNRKDQGQSQKMNVGAFPAVFLINPDKNKSYPIAYGLTSINEIKDSIVNTVTQYGKVKLDA